MKNFKTIITVIALSLSTVFTVVANDVDPKNNKETKKLRTEMSLLIGKNIPVKLNKTTTAQVSFTVNNKNEIVVLSVESKLNDLNSFVKKKLNYKKLVTKAVKKGEVYIVPLKVNVK
ncbi:hypothetical protein [Polaribacter aestuariivivens]|uniref:hypothetical protein n=1 Tax=Polaribacter aestuariivivens TaxID=2304626 RepID=UPI003F497DC8